ncbi:MAG: hypothetical protein KGS45_00770 [Planctomycetes bacterium]|nr:hypothetical protein [Planctomycetota bacterium]
MPVRIQMLSGHSAAAPRGGLLVGLILGLLILVALAIFLLPFVLIAGALGLVAFGLYKLNRWIRTLGQPRARPPVEGEDFDSLRARLEQRGTLNSTTATNDTTQSSPSDQVDDLGRRNVRVVGTQH